MGRSAGTGSPVWFRCYNDRRGVGIDHTVRLTGRERPSPAKKGHTKGSRSSWFLREYACSCGHVGWSNHVDLARMAGKTRKEDYEAYRGG